MSDENKCRSCGQKILWAITPANKRMPLDPTPVPDGNIVLVTRGEFLSPLAVTGASGSPRYKSHFATCPNAAQHRRKK